jgi:drug/metabolite transporter (DMT)-like permease
MPKPKLTAKGAEALFAAAFLYSLSAPLVREMGVMWGDLAQTWVRWALVAVMLFAYMAIRKSTATIPKSKLKYALALSISFACVVMFFTLSVQKTTIANSLFTFYAANMISSFLTGTILLKETVSKPKIIAIMFALAGLSMYSGSLIAGSLGIVFAVVAGLAEGISNVFRKKLAGVNRNAVIRLQYGVGTVFVGLVTLLSKDEILRGASLHGVVATVAFALLLIVAGNLLLYGYEHFDVNIGTVIMSMELVFAAFLGWALYNEVPAANELMGGLLIFTGSILGSIDADRLKFKRSIPPSAV